MIYFENLVNQGEGFNTHVMRYTMCVSLSNFLERDFYFAAGNPSTTPPEYAVKGPYNDRFSVLLESARSTVTDLVIIPNRGVPSVDREIENKLEIEVLMSHFLTTDELRQRFEGTFIWNAFGVGRFPLIREELQNYDLLEFTHQTITSPSYAYFLRKREKDALLRSVALRYINEVEELAGDIVRDLGNYYAVHIRLGDFLSVYESEGYDIKEREYRDYITATFPDHDMPIAIATDALHQKDLLEKIFHGYKTIFIDEVVFENYAGRYRELPFTDFNVLTIVNQLLCASGESFIGTYRSTFTSIIHRLRQERGEKKDFNFFPDSRVSKLLGPSQTLVPDRSGFFDWNRYSVFSENLHDMAWRREWDHDLTSLDL